VPDGRVSGADLRSTLARTGKAGAIRLVDGVTDPTICNGCLRQHRPTSSPDPSSTKGEIIPDPANSSFPDR
jgi:hypothetical protein